MIHRSILSRLVVLVAAFSALGFSSAAFSQTTWTLEIDATQLSRRLLDATLEIPVPSRLVRSGGKLALWYPKWVPGAHAPGGPVENIGGLEIRSADGTILEWQRTPGEVYRLEVEVPGGAKSIVMQIRYITNQPRTNSVGLDSYGYEQIGMISANTLLFYEEGADLTTTQIEMSVQLPKEWKAATALRTRSAESGRIEYRPVSIEELVDSPVLVGRFSRIYDLVTESASAGTPPHALHVISEAKTGVELDAKVVAGFRAMVSEASALFGSHPFPSFDILLGSSETFGPNGLEHSKSTFNVLPIEALTEPDVLKGWNRLLVPHEYVHAWCGKYRRPKGMITRDFHSPKDTRELWVYEGLAQYLGNLLEVRSGLMTPEEYRWDLLGKIRTTVHQQGRRWRTLEDTGNAAHILRAGSRSWSHLRRSQDYYVEGALIWMEIDARLRNLTSGERSLDDFARQFFFYRKGMEHPNGHDRGEIVEILTGLAEDDWAGFLDARLNQPGERFELGLLEELGYHLQYANEPPAPPEGTSRSDRDSIDAVDSIGMLVDKDGQVRKVLLGSAADRAGLGPGMKIAGVGEYVWSQTRFDEALAATVSEPAIELLVISGDRFVKRTIEYDQGPKHMVLVREESKPDRLAEIAAPLVRAR